jgi:hypothetical protein
MPYFYPIYGLWIESSAPLPGLVSTPGRKAVDVCISLGKDHPSLSVKLEKTLWYMSPKDKKGEWVEVYQLAKGAFFYFRYSDGVRFIIEKTGAKVWANWSQNLRLEDAAVYLLGHIIGFVLGLRGFFCMHASAVGLGDRAIALMAPSGGGKSTTAAAFACMGYPVITDDLLALAIEKGRYFVQPGYPYLSLWPQSADALYKNFGDLPRISPHHLTWNKRYLDLAGTIRRFQQHPLELAAIYTGNFTNTPKSCGIEKLSGRNAVVTLLANRYRFPLIEKAGLADEFIHINQIAAAIPIRRISFHRKFDQLPQLCEMIVADFKTLYPETDDLSRRAHASVFR